MVFSVNQQKTRTIGRMGMTMEGAGKTFLVEYGLSATKPPEYPLPAPKVDHAAFLISNVSTRSSPSAFTIFLATRLSSKKISISTGCGFIGLLN